MNKLEKSEQSKKLRIFFNGLANKQKKMTIEEIEMCSEICMIIIQYYAFLDLPNEELMEKIIFEVNFVKPLDGEDEEYLKDKLHPLLQSRQPEIKVTWEQFEKAMTKFVKHWDIIEMQDWLESLGIKVGKK